MIAPIEWTRFSNDNETLEFLRKNGVVSANASAVKTLLYKGPYSDSVEICRIVGCSSPFTAVIEINGALHCIHADCLNEMQEGMSKYLRELKLLRKLESYVVLDFETTGLSAKEDKIIEIAAIKYFGNLEVDVFSTLVNPLCKLPSKIVSLTGITDNELCGAPCIAEVVEKLHTFIGDNAIVAHNAPFEKMFLESVYAKNGYTLSNRFIDTLPLARTKYPKFDNHKLQTLIDKLNIKKGSAHRALSDTQATAELFRICIAEGA